MKEVRQTEIEKKIKQQLEVIGCCIFLLIIIGVPSLLTTIVFGSKVALVITLSLAIIVLILTVITVVDIKLKKSKLKELENENS